MLSVSMCVPSASWPPLEAVFQIKRKLEYFDETKVRIF